jgi:predicted ATPase
MPPVRRLEAGISDPNLQGTARWVRNQIDGWRLYHLHDSSVSSPMRKTAKVDDNEFLRPDGSNLAAFLYYLRERHGDSYSLIQKTVQRVAPFFEDFRLKPLRLKPDDIKLEWRHQNSDQYFDVSSLSDGTLRFIALATLFLQPENHRPSTILVDEPELGLHPYAIGMLASLIRQASVDTQVIVSTQSSLLLDHFQPEDVLVADRVDGGTQLTRRIPSDWQGGWRITASVSCGKRLNSGDALLGADRWLACWSTWKAKPKRPSSTRSCGITCWREATAR